MIKVYGETHRFVRQTAGAGGHQKWPEGVLGGRKIPCHGNDNLRMAQATSRQYGDERLGTRKTAKGEYRAQRADRTPYARKEAGGKKYGQAVSV